MEDKQRFCDLLLPVLQATRELYDLIGLSYEPTAEMVTAYFSGGSKKRVNVAGDSGTAMILDIIRAIR